VPRGATWSRLPSARAPDRHLRLSFAFAAWLTIGCVGEGDVTEVPGTSPSEPGAENIGFELDDAAVNTRVEQAISRDSLCDVVWFNRYWKPDMERQDAGDLVAFLAVARAKSFTAASVKLGISSSALSHLMLGLEERLGVRLLNRTTRSVSPTEAGKKLIEAVGNRFDEIDVAVLALGELRDKPAGNIRITATEYASEAILMPALQKFLPAYPDIKVEIIVDYGLSNIVADQYDAGIRPGELVDKDMIAVRVSPDLRMAIVGSPAYFSSRTIPSHPRDLTDHNCLNLRLPSHGGLYTWEFEKAGRVLNVRVDGQLIFNSASTMLAASLQGFGLAYLQEGQVSEYLADGRFVRVLADWCEPYSGYHLYYPSRRQISPAFGLLIEALRYRPSGPG
jgi:DNA-binding transcriptional LysR family regulator